MRIGIDCRLIDHVQNTGISRYTEFLIDYYLSRFNRTDIYLITNESGFNCSNCNVLYTKLKPYNLGDFVFFSAYIKSKNLNVLHSPFYSGFFMKSDNLLSIVTVHDLMFKRVPDFFSSNAIVNMLKARYFDLIVRKSLKNADIIISISETTKQDVSDLYKLESKHIPENSEIKYNADASILSRHDLRNKSFFFYCGNTRPHKNLDFIIEIFNGNSNLPPLVLAGRGHINSTNVISVGLVSDEELNALYSASIAFIFPSKYEGFGLPILESLRLKTPVIASRISAFLEFNSRNVYFFELGNKVEFLSAINNAISNCFIDEQHFFEKYDQQYIYSLNDALILNLIAK